MDLPVIAFTTIDDFAAWIAEQPDGSSGLWLKIAKKGAPEPTISYDQAVDVALRDGWIDSQKKSHDADHWVQRFSPRTARSRWSQINRTKVLALVESGQMRPAGLREVERAKADGRWDAAYASQRTMTVPDDLQAALEANPAARDFFGTLSAVNRYAILYRVHDAKKPETRARRIEKFVAMLAAGEQIHP
jgi:uncharacterized protein YdeI (YjbR/CyaY-like superfamily)